MERESKISPRMFRGPAGSGYSIPVGNSTILEAPQLSPLINFEESVSDSVTLMELSCLTKHDGSIIGKPEGNTTFRDFLRFNMEVWEKIPCRLTIRVSSEKFNTIVSVYDFMRRVWPVKDSKIYLFDEPVEISQLYIILIYEAAALEESTTGAFTALRMYLDLGGKSIFN